MRNAINCKGFTLAEVTVAAALFGLVAAIALPAYVGAFRESKSCGSQVVFTADARIAQQRITKYVALGRSAVVISNGVNIYAMNMINYARIEYVDIDNNVASEGNNVLAYYPDGNTKLNRVILCTRVSDIPNTTMFSIINSTPCSVGFAFHVGDTTNSFNAAAGSSSGFGYQGVDMRFTATPRNLLRQYE